MLALTNGAVAGSAQGPACFKNDKDKWTAIVDVYRTRCMEHSKQTARGSSARAALRCVSSVLVYEPTRRSTISLCCPGLAEQGR